MNGPTEQRADHTITCLACGSQDTAHWADAHDIEYHSTPESFAYHRCNRCAALSIDPVPADRLGEIYPANYYSYASPGRSLAQRVKLRLDQRHFRAVLTGLPGRELSLLDVGGGAGAELLIARQSDPRVSRTTVVDLDPAARPLAEHNGHTYVCSRIEDFETDDRFHAIFLLNLIEHVRDPGAVLAQVARLLAPGGVLVVKTPNYDALDARLFRNRSWAGLHCPRHWVLFTKEGFADLAERRGLRVRSAGYTQGAPFWSASTLAWLAERGWVRVSRQRPVVRHPLFAVLTLLFAAFDFLRLPFSHPSQMQFVLEVESARVESQRSW